MGWRPPSSLFILFKIYLGQNKDWWTLPKKQTFYNLPKEKVIKKEFYLRSLAFRCFQKESGVFVATLSDEGVEFIF